MRVVNLASGSKGNCTFIEAGSTKILVDVGLSLKEIEHRLSLIGENISQIDSVLITHEHSDHIKGLAAVIKNTNARIYIHKRVVSEVLSFDQQTLDTRISQIQELPFHINDCLVVPFALRHDSLCCLGFRIEHGGRSVVIATDLGCMSTTILDIMSGADLVFIESNHDKSMLLGCHYPYYLKQRILSDDGHFSNAQAAATIVQLAKRGTKHFVLSHISQNSNTVELALLESANALENAGFVLEKDVFLRYARQDRPGNNFILGDKNE